MNTNATTNANEEPMFRERLKFYADTPGEKNKYFCWDIKSILALQEALERFFDKGWNIRSAWYEKIDLSTGEIIENTKLNIKELLDKYCDEKVKKQFKAKQRSSLY